MILRPYQQSIIDQARTELMAKRNPLIVSPCGSGKGSLIAYMVKGAVDRGYRVIFAVYGQALVLDMSENRVAGLGIEHGVLMGGHRRERWHPVQVASISTLCRMEHPPLADLIIADEADGTGSDTWKKTLAKYPDAHLIGMTATPSRLDGKGLGKANGGLFDSMILGPSEEELIADGYLVGSRVFQGPPIDKKGIRKAGGKFNQQDLSAWAASKVRRIGDIFDQWKKHAYGLKTTAFGVDKKDANNITEKFRDNGIQWAYIDSDTPKDERKNILRDLDNPSSGLLGVSSVDCISRGSDHPIIQCILAGRMSLSLSWWRQMLGRGSRPYPGKEWFMVLDLADGTRTHGDGTDGNPPWGIFEFSPPWSLDGDAIKHSEDDKKPPRVITCDKSYRWPDGRVQHGCRRTFRAGPKNCPYCGIILKISERKIEVEAGELQEIIAPRKAVPLANAPERADYERLLEEARMKGKNDGWVNFVFVKKHYGGAFKSHLKDWRVDWLSRKLNKELEKETVEA